MLERTYVSRSRMLILHVVPMAGAWVAFVLMISAALAMAMCYEGWRATKSFFGTQGRPA